MAAEPTFDQTLTTDGITVRLHRVGEKLTVELTDPSGALRELEVVDTASTQTLATVSDLGAQARRQVALAPLLAALDTMDQATVDTVWELLHPFPSTAEAHNQLWWAVCEAGHEREWAQIMEAVRARCELFGLSPSSHVTMPIQAGAFRELIGTRGYTAEHYEALTSPWRVLVGRIHPDDEDLTESTYGLDAPQVVTALRQFATAEVAIDDSTAVRLLRARPIFRDLRYVTALAKAQRLVAELGRENAWRQVTASTSRSLAHLGRARRVETTTVLREVVLGLVLRDQIGSDWSKFNQRDYDTLTSAWRTQIGTVHPHDADMFQPPA